LVKKTSSFLVLCMILQLFVAYGISYADSPPTVTVTSSPNPSVYGETVTIVATVASNPPGTAPTGTVEFSYGSSGPVTVPVDAAGQAVFTASDMEVGTTTITAAYSGDGNLDPATGTTSHTVNQGDTTTSVTATPDPSVYGESVTVAATVTAVAPSSGTPTGTVTFTINGLPQTASLDATGTAVVTTNSINVGSGTITAAYNADTNFSGSTGTTAYTVNQGSTTTAVTVSPDPSVYGETVTISATVTADAPSSGTPTGTVTFTINGLPQTASLDATGTAVVTTNSINVGSGTITATYNADTNFSGSTGTTAYTVNQGSTTTAVTVSPDPSVYGETMTISATVTANAPSSGTPTGSVTFTIGGLPQTVTLDATGTAAITTSSINVNSGTITATYNADTNFSGSTGTTTYTVNQASTTTSVTVTPDPSVYGETVTIAATVTADAPGSGTPTGTVTFTVGGLTQTVALDATGTAALTTSSIDVGSGTITATYNSDPNFSSSVGTTSYTVNKADTTTSVTIAPNPSVYGETVTISATVAANAPSSGTPTGTVTFTIGGLPQTVTLDATGTAAITTSSINAGSGTITATYNSDSNFNSSVGTTTYTVNQGSTTTAVTISPDPSVYGEAVTIAATVTVNAPSSGTPTGSVIFTIGGITQTVTLDASGIAALTTSSIAVGSGTITATYTGNTNLSGSAGTTSYTVNQASTTTSVTIAPDPSVYGQPVTIAATVAAVAPGSGTPTGSVTFDIGGMTQTVTLDATGTAAITTSSINAGSGTITATYNADTNFSSSVGTTSYTVNPASTTTSVTATPDPSVYGETVTIAATVTANAPSSGTPTGSVTFTINGLPQTATLDASGTAAITTSSINVGSGMITAAYSGDPNFGASVSLTSYTVNKADTTTTVTTSPNPSALGATVTATATVTAAAPGSGTPTGTVTFIIGGLPQTATLDGSGTAAVTASNLSAGLQLITATYSGDASFTSSVATASHTVSVNNDAALSDLAITGGTLNPAFDPATLAYASNVPYVVRSLTVTAALPANATLKVNGVAVANGDPIPTIALQVGLNTIQIEVTAEDGITKKTYTIEVRRAADTPMGPIIVPTPTPTPTPGPTPTPEGFEVIVNGKPQGQIAQASTATEGGKSTVTATVDGAQLAAQLGNEGNQSTVIIPVKTSADKVSTVLTGEAVKSMENKAAILEIQTQNGNYKLPASEVLIDQVSEKLGTSVALSDIVVNVDIAKSGESKTKQLTNAATKSGFTVVGTPVDFTVTATYNGTTVNVDKFQSYVEREIPLPDGVDGSRITTAIVVDEDGATHHVPTYIVNHDGHSYATIHSLTNSTYTLVWHPAAFADVEGHWSQAAVNDMASRMVVNGTDDTHFTPNAAITRAEFAAIIVRSLGLADNGHNAGFSDVADSAWYAGAVAKAHEYGIIEGYEDGSFGPTQTITRQEAMVMIARAMKLTGLNSDISSADADAALAAFADQASVAGWAKQSVAAAVQSQLVNGSEIGLQPGSNITRAETAAIVQRMLIAANLIDDSNSK